MYTYIVSEMRKREVELAGAAASVRAALRTAFADQTAFAMKAMKLVQAAEALSAAMFAEDFAAAEAEALCEAYAS